MTFTIAAVLFILPPPVSGLEVCSSCHRHICGSVRSPWIDAHTCRVGKVSLVPSLIQSVLSCYSGIHAEVLESALIQICHHGIAKPSFFQGWDKSGTLNAEAHDVGFAFMDYKLIFLPQNSVAALLRWEQNSGSRGESTGIPSMLV